MKFTLHWLKQHLETKASLTEICDKLTAIGLEVEAIEDHGKALAPFIIAQVLTAEKHPQADRLKVTTVDTGKEKLQVICGAPNCRAGLKVVLARPGDVMPDSGEPLKKGLIRGLESQGMICALDELGLQKEETDGIIELPADAPIGASFAHYAGYDDPVIEINLTPNRPDCMGVYGIARDLAAAGLGTLKPLTIKSIKGTKESPIKVTLDFPKGEEGCSLFVGRLIRNVKNGPSPGWLQDRLRMIGLRPISALVDITNYTTFDCARPLHVFDAKKIKGNLWVRPAKGGEKLAALNGKTYEFEKGMTVIGDDTGVISLAGIIGGESTACDENTKDVFIECALFDPLRTARTGRKLQITSDARYRFERGVDPLFVIPGAEMATQLVVDLCGTAATDVSLLFVAGKANAREHPLDLDPTKCRRHIGLDVTEAEQENILKKLGFDVKPKDKKLSVMPPSWRPDIEGAEDLLEEIARMKGYDHIPATPLKNPYPVTVSAIDGADRRVELAKRTFAGQGLLEAVTWSFMPGAIAAQFGFTDPHLRLVNPISSDLDVMRPSILGNLIMAAKRNADRGFGDVGLFEVGPVYKNATPEGQEMMGAAVRAGMTPRHWASHARAIDAFDMKADAMAVLLAAGAPVASLQVTADAPSWYHPGRSGCLRLGPTLLAMFGEIHPAVLAACDASAPLAACEIFLAAIPQSRASGNARPLLKLEPLQPVTRDFAFVVNRDVTTAKLVKAIRDADKNLIRDVTVFDIYEGDRIDPEKKSVALGVTIQPNEHTLTESELESVAKKIAECVTKATGATLRA